MTRWIIVEDSVDRARIYSSAIVASRPEDEIVYLSVIDEERNDDDFPAFDPTVSIFHARSNDKATSILNEYAQGDSIILLDIWLPGVHSHSPRDYQESGSWLTSWVKQWLLVNLTGVVSIISTESNPVAFINVCGGYSNIFYCTDAADVGLGRQSHYMDNANKVIDFTINKWTEHNFPHESITVSDFVSELSSFSHELIDTDNSPAREVLFRLLRLRPDSFEKKFCVDEKPERLKKVVREALKNIGGCVTSDLNKPPKCLCLRGAWLLSLGVFIEEIDSSGWESLFSIDEFLQKNSYPPLHSFKSSPSRLALIKNFCETCKLLFTHDDDEIPHSVIGIRLRNSELSFVLNFSLKGHEYSLYNRIYNRIEGYSTGNFEEFHGTTDALWRLCVEMNTSDIEFKNTGVLMNQECNIRIESEGDGTRITFSHD